MDPIFKGYRVQISVFIDFLFFESGNDDCPETSELIANLRCVTFPKVEDLNVIFKNWVVRGSLLGAQMQRNFLIFPPICVQDPNTAFAHTTTEFVAQYNSNPVMCESQ
jgi:hypothetical protein